jgi:phosphomannomutase
MKKIIAFDLDGTLAPSKSPLPDRIGELLNRLLNVFEVCVISGGKFEQFQKQLLNGLHAEPGLLERLHLMPTCGTRYYAFDIAKNDWAQVYAEDFTEAQKQKIIVALKKAVKELGLQEKKVYGETIEDRGSQVTLSTLGQDIVDELGLEGVRIKEEWDPDNKKKEAIREFVAPLIPEFEVKVGGLTSIDITKPGIDKAYGMKKLTERLSISKQDILFIGDRLKEGGNDYPVKAMGIDCLEVSRWEDTALVLEAILHVV